MKVTVLQSAEDHLAEGVGFYEQQSDGLGVDFLHALLADIAALARYGGIHSRCFGFHRSVADRFPFAVYYRLDGEEVKVHAVLDCRRSPAWIRRRLRRT